jgi:hypothetical protein
MLAAFRAVDLVLHAIPFVVGAVLAVKLLRLVHRSNPHHR